MNIFDDFSVKEYVEYKLHELVHPISNQGNRWNFRCPICGDSKKNRRKARGNYYPRTVSYHCFNEGCTASGLFIISKFSNMEITDIKRDYIEYMRKNQSLGHSGIPRSQPKPEANIRPILTESISISNDWIDLPPNIQKMIDDRKIMSAPFKPDKWKLFYNKKTNRIVVPWYRNNKMVFYQERAIDSNDYPKYKNATDLDKDLFNYDMIDESLQYVFALEGVFDAIFVKNGIAMAGVKLTDTQKTLLDSKFPEKIYFLDNPWQDKTAFDKILKMAGESMNYKIFLWPQSIKEKDVNEYVMKHNDNPFADINFLNANVISIGKAIFSLRFNKRM